MLGENPLESNDGLKALFEDEVPDEAFQIRVIWLLIIVQLSAVVIEKCEFD